MSERKRVARIFKMRGLSIQSTALDALLNVLSRERGPSTSSSRRGGADETLLAIIDEVKERMVQGGRGCDGIVTASLLGEVVADLSRDSKDVAEEAVQLLDAFRTPRLTYDPMRKAFALEPHVEGKKTVYGDATDKVDMFGQRYALVQQRILRQDIFQPKLVTARRGRSGRGQGGGTHALTPVESLLGRSGVRYLLGMIVQVEEGRYYLEDHTAQVPLDLSRASLLTDGFVTENSIVLVEGEAVDGVLHVHNMGSPIVEDRAASIRAMGLQNSDIFDSVGSLSELEKLRDQELRHGQEGMFVVLSDVYLDSPSVMEKIERMLEGYSDFRPLPIFVFMGNFTSRPLCASEGTKAFAGYFEDLANVICKFPNVAEEGRFVFVPGPNDPGVAGVLPRGPVPRCFTSSLRSRVRHAAFASNPCRVRYFTKEIVLFRDDLVGKLRRHCLLEPGSGRGGDEGTVTSAGGDGGGPSRHAVKTVLDQGHLSPLPLAAGPVYWQHDHAMRLYPFPDALIAGDRVDQYYENYEGCDAINPGPFSNGFNFVVYRPVGEVGKSQTKSDVEFSQIE